MVERLAVSSRDLEPAGRASASVKQLRANRRNARRSTGPRTPEGKARSSRNATRHGLFCTDIVIAGEDEQEFRQYRIEMLRCTDPRNTLELQFAEQVIRAGWKLKRFQRSEVELFHDRTNHLERTRPGEAIEPGYVLGDLLWGGGELQRFQTYERMLTNMMHRAMEQLRKLKKVEPAAIPSPFAATLIATEQQQLEKHENEANSAPADVSDEPAEGYTTDMEQINTDEEGLNGQEVTIEPSEADPPGDWVT